ncbi:hypothetical protein [Nocardia cyriacigeorgica]|uniref:hypothetical protein n=1 Tax=Nocardia cyriacigeorgica TaxID=135487 RepID=UPI0024562BA1|nr:hypothetical protein [Nocardia cyriacigeorgica]
MALAHWSTGYADFHEEIWAPPPEPPRPLRLPCKECGATFSDADLLREHIFGEHPVSRPVLLRSGIACGDAQLLVQQHTVAGDWSVANCTSARLNGTEIAPADLGERLSTSRGIVVVELGNSRSNRSYEFDFSIPMAGDLHGVDTAVEALLAAGDINTSTISSFFDRAQSFETARNYAGGIAEYLYWLAGRRTGVDPATAARYREKLNRAADLLGEIRRPVALAITSLISFHFNHFDEAGSRALSPRLRAVSGRLAQMWAAKTDVADAGPLSGQLSHLERRLLDDDTSELIELCSHPLDPGASAQVAAFVHDCLDHYDQVKALVFIAEHHIATLDPRAASAVRDASQNGLPEHWVNSRLDLTTSEGSTWQTAPDARASRRRPAEAVAPARATGGRPTPLTVRPSARVEQRRTPASARPPAPEPPQAGGRKGEPAGTPTTEPRSHTSESRIGSSNNRRNPGAPVISNTGNPATAKRTDPAQTTSPRATGQDRTSNAAATNTVGSARQTTRIASEADATTNPSIAKAAANPDKTPATAGTPTTAATHPPKATTTAPGSATTRRPHPLAGLHSPAKPGRTAEPRTPDRSPAESAPPPPVSDTPPWQVETATPSTNPTVIGPGHSPESPAPKRKPWRRLFSRGR